MRCVRVVVLLVLAALAGSVLIAAEEQPLVAGSEGVPTPKKTRDVKPKYPPQAIAQGLRGIVILELLIDTRGNVASASVVRGVPGLDEAAIAAVRQWRYEPVKVDGKAVSIRLTVPIAFSLALPGLLRDAGIPELRQGGAPVFPDRAEGGTAVAEVTLEPDGQVGSVQVVQGGEPWVGALVAALRTWRFSPPPEDVTLSFRVEADFIAGGSGAKRLVLRAAGLRQVDLLDAAHVATTARQSAQAPETPAQDAARTQPPPDQGAPPQPPPGAPARPGSAPDAPPPPATPSGPGTSAVLPPAAAPPSSQPPTSNAPTQGTAPPAGPAAPPIEGITVPPPPPAPENGISVVRDVRLEPGVPELSRGRRPVPPPFARIAGATGTVEVTFSVNAAGATLVQGASGPDLLKKAAEQAVASWVFRRTRADRAYLLATFNYRSDSANAVVRPQSTPATTGAPAPAASAPVVPAAPASAEPAPAIASPGVAPAAASPGSVPSGTSVPAQASPDSPPARPKDPPRSE